MDNNPLVEFDYSNKPVIQMEKTYDRFSWEWVLCGTGTLSEIEDKSLGQRFLDPTDSVQPDLIIEKPEEDCEP